MEKTRVSKRNQKRAEQVRFAKLRYQALKDKRQPVEVQPYVIDGRNGQAWINSILHYLLWRSGSSWRRLTDPKQRWDPERWYYLDGYRLLNELSRKYIPDAQCNCKYCRERSPEFQQQLKRLHESIQQQTLEEMQRCIASCQESEVAIRKPAASVGRADLLSNYNQKRSLP